MDDSPVSVHIWMSLYDWVCVRGRGWRVTANHHRLLAKGDIGTRQRVQGHGCGVRESRWGLGDDNKVSEICKAAGALVTENDRLWRVAHALTGKNYKSDLEEICISEPDLRFNVPKNMEESKVKFEYKPTFTAQSRRKQERQNEVQWTRCIWEH